MVANLSPLTLAMYNHGLGIWHSYPFLQGGCVAISLAYRCRQNASRQIALAAYSEDITYTPRTASDTVDPAIRYDDAITSWIIGTLPAHGQLWDGHQQVTATPHVVSGDFGPDGITYIPDPDYLGADSFQFRVTDSSGGSALGTVYIGVENEYSVPAGMEELPSVTHTPYADASTFVEGVDWWIDNSHPDASDANVGGKGSPTAPRLTFPGSGSSIAAGERVFVRGGVTVPYRLRNSGWQQLITNGVAGNPAIVSGLVNAAPKPRITLDPSRTVTTLRLESNYTIIEGLDFDGVQLQRRNDTGGKDQGNCVLRHCSVHDVQSSGGSSMLSRDGLGSNIVFYDVHIGRNGAAGVEHHGIGVFGPEVFVLDCLIHHNAGDAIQANSNSAIGLYIGRTAMHSDGENAVDLKREENIVIVECFCWDYRITSFGSNDSDGAALLANVDEAGNPPEKVLFARNRIWDCSVGIRHQGDTLWTDANWFWQIRQEDGNGTAIRVGNNDSVSTYTERITNNVMHKVDCGIWNYSPVKSNGDRIIAGNVFGELNPTSTRPYHIQVDPGHLTSETPGYHIDYNYYLGEAKFNGGSGILDLAAMRTTHGFESNGAEHIDPQFTNAPQFDLRPTAQFIGLGQNIEQATYAEFESLYGRNIRVDIDGNARLQTAWNIGAAA